MAAPAGAEGGSADGLAQPRLARAAWAELRPALPAGHLRNERAIVEATAYRARASLSGSVA